MSTLILNTIFKPKIIFKKKIFICQIGKKGKIIKHLKKDGDKSTPIGNWKIEKIYLRRDKNLNLKIKKSIRNKIVYIKKNFFWCDDSNSIFYNKLLTSENSKALKISYEKLYRHDDVYDIILQLDYNKKPIIKNKGSAIFIHCSFYDLRPTLGCIAVKKNILKFIINNLQKRNYIYIR